MPRSGSGLMIRASVEIPNLSNSFSNPEFPAQTIPICSAPNLRHCSIKCPSTDVTPHGNNNFGRPILADFPAAKITTPNVIAYPWPTTTINHLAR